MPWVRLDEETALHRLERIVLAPPELLERVVCSGPRPEVVAVFQERAIYLQNWTSSSWVVQRVQCISVV